MTERTRSGWINKYDIEHGTITFWENEDLLHQTQNIYLKATLSWEEPELDIVIGGLYKATLGEIVLVVEKAKFARMYIVIMVKPSNDHQLIGKRYAYGSVSLKERIEL